MREEDHHSLDYEERFAEEEVVLSACDEEQEEMDCLFTDDDFEKFKALPAIMNVPAPLTSGVPEVFEEMKSFSPAVAIEQPKKTAVQPTSFKISPDHPQI